jgi:hypothetical protein
MPLSIQAFCGVFWVAGFSTYYMQLAGYSTAMSFKLGIVQQVISMVGNLCAVSRTSCSCVSFKPRRSTTRICTDALPRFANDSVSSSNESDVELSPSGASSP